MTSWWGGSAALAQEHSAVHTPAPATTRRQADIVTLDLTQFEQDCVRLMGIATDERRPDVLVAIRTGGAFVADVMARAVQPRSRILPITCRRPSTRIKQATSWLMAVLTLLPRPLLDRLRLLEHRLLIRRPPRRAASRYRFDELEIDALSRWLVTAGEAPFLLVVDDAVDSGVTLRHVVTMLRRHAPPGAVIRSAVIAVTTRQPAIMPDHVLYRGQLCRFPWSYDA